MALLRINNGALTINDSGNWDDSQVPPSTQRTGTVAPTLTTGFRGDANFQQLHFVSSQADETQFSVQLPHSRKKSSAIYPHVHFCPAVNIADGTYNVQFILEYYAANINAQFPASPQTYTMTKNFTVSSNNHIWMHFLAGNVTPITNTFGISSILVCRLYRDNTVANNYGQPVSLLGFDIHYYVDSLGSDDVISKSF
jgi:hypothetical protein